LGLKEKINEDLKQAMLSKNESLVESLRSIRAEIIKFDKSGLNREMNEQDELEILGRMVKQRKESVDMFKGAGRNDLVDKELRQIEIISGYLPEQLSKADAENIIDRIISETGANGPKDFGKVMSPAMKELKGKFDGKEAQEIIKSRLNK
jgi:uncharacterized protein YqeY